MPAPITSQWRRLRHVYSMLSNLEKEGIDSSLATHNMLLDIRIVVETLIKKARVE
jgi:hypothetical protein